jgi:hypothetical protein
MHFIMRSRASFVLVLLLQADISHYFVLPMHTCSKLKVRVQAGTAVCVFRLELCRTYISFCSLAFRTLSSVTDNWQATWN